MRNRQNGITSSNGLSFTPVPRIQIVTIEPALDLRDRAVRLPARRDDTFRRAAREEDRGAQGKLDL